MRNTQQQQQESKVAVPESWDVGSNNCITAINVQGTTPYSFPNHHHHHDIDHPNNHEKSEWQKFLSFVRPGFLVSLAYLDPDNLETDLQAGANHRYELLWVVLIGLVFALIIQSLAANLGVSTDKHLSELCKAKYPKLVKYYIWLLAEIAVIVADILEVRKLEMLIAMLVFVMAGCFFREMSYLKSPTSGVITGMFVPKLADQGATAGAIALLGAFVLP
ncbi:hypothetical protein J1N35_023690 [Gossypium stocksii]|uniref:Uncharacterized protein n=1 Tax=Gossypium stocksii TaxID=47602 RepID=A0A9D3VKQ1_9ROSI|nr:hypothetical protein J1N35_023690 [Gossypium stocksii]